MMDHSNWRAIVQRAWEMIGVGKCTRHILLCSHYAVIQSKHAVTQNSYDTACVYNRLCFN